MDTGTSSLSTSVLGWRESLLGWRESLKSFSKINHYRTIPQFLVAYFLFLPVFTLALFQNLKGYSCVYKTELFSRQKMYGT